MIINVENHFVVCQQGLIHQIQQLKILKFLFVFCFSFTFFDLVFDLLFRLREITFLLLAPLQRFCSIFFLNKRERNDLICKKIDWPAICSRSGSMGGG